MRILIVAAMAAGMTLPAAAADGETEWAAALAEGVVKPAPQPSLEGAIIRDQTTAVDVELNSKTVKCSAADYSGPMLKVLVPRLAELTVLNHRNTSEGAPCVAAGRCGKIGPQDILKDGDGVEEIPVRVVLKKVISLQGDICHVALVETVSTTIRGVPFFHERSQQVANRAAADCR